VAGDCDILPPGVDGAIFFTNAEQAGPGKYPPTIFVTKKQGYAIRAAVAANPRVQVTVTRYNDNTPGQHMGFVYGGSAAAGLSAGAAAVVWMANK
jgi:hypothetical protein